MKEPANSALPLGGNRLFQSTDLDETRAIVAQKFCDHRLDQMSKSDRLNAVHNRAEGRATSLNFIRYGADVEIEPGELGSFYLIQIPMTGQARIDNSLGEVETGPGLGSVLNPHHHTAMRWHKGCSQLLLQIDEKQLNTVATRLVGRRLSTPVTFQTAVDQGLAEVDLWVRKLRTCFSLADKGAIYGDGNLPSQMLIEDQLIEEFLLCQPSNISGLLTDDIKQVDNLYVRRAMQFVREHFNEAITIGRIASAVEVSPRSLQLGFKAELGVTPLQFLREIRLREARHALATAPEADTIGEISERCGFGHFGRFSVDYKLRFGESPHETRRNCD